jgi:hypothetical protein
MNAEAVGMADAARGSLGCSSKGNTWKSAVPVICVFNGIVVQMVFYDNERHSLPHIHVQYGDDKASFSINDGSVLAGSLPPRQTRLIRTWIDLRREELMADWNLAINGATLKPIDPLR